MLREWMPMLIVIPFFSGDKPLAIQLMDWIYERGCGVNHDCLLIVDRSTDSGGIIDVAKQAFQNVYEAASEPAGRQGEWGKGTVDATAANEMWLTAGIYIQHTFPKRRWFWLEPDAIPTRKTAFDEIEDEDRRGTVQPDALGKPKAFTGAYVNIPPHEPHMSGIAVYPPIVADHSLDMAIPGKIAWDYAGRRDTVSKKKAHFTDLIQHEYRTDGVAPTFPTIESLCTIRQRTAVYHRCKDGTLISRLREKMSMDNSGRSVAVQAAPEAPVPNGIPGCVEELRQRVHDLELQMAKVMQPTLTAPAVLSAWKANGKRAKFKTPAKRTTEQQQAINERMAKARAGRGKKLVKK